MSIFYNHLKAVIEFYRIAEAQEVTRDDFLRLQQFEADILDARNAGYYNNLQYKSIINAWHDLIEKYRQATAAIDPTYAAANNRRVK